MPRRMPSALERLKSLEAKKQDIIEQRKKELLAIIECCNALTIDDALLTGFLLFATDSTNKDHPTLKDLKELAKSSNIKFLPKLFRKKRTKKA